MLFLFFSIRDLTCGAEVCVHDPHSSGIHRFRELPLAVLPSLVLP
jgi:hypothetical protein